MKRGRGEAKNKCYWLPSVEGDARVVGIRGWGLGRNDAGQEQRQAVRRCDGGVQWRFIAINALEAQEANEAGKRRRRETEPPPSTPPHGSEDR